MSLELMMARLAGPPPCRCAACASRRATQLAQALQEKFDPSAAVRRIL
jgi:hypothetical protein